MKRRQPNRRGYGVLSALAEPQYSALVALPTSDLRAALVALDELSETNCSWIVYRAREFLRTCVAAWLIDRLDSVPCLGCHRLARVSLDRRVACWHCGMRRRLRRGELAALERAADDKWNKDKKRIECGSRGPRIPEMLRCRA